MNRNIVYWKGICIGEILEPVVDNFDIFGKWRPMNDIEELDGFIKDIEDNEDAYICLGDSNSGFIATVNEIPDDYIDIRCRGKYTDIKSVIHTPEYYETLFFNKQ